MQYWKLETDDPLYKSKFGDTNIRQFQVITDHNGQRDKVGKVLDALTDGYQSIYLHVETGSWVSPEWVVVPLGEYQLQPRERALYLLGSIPTNSDLANANANGSRLANDYHSYPAQSAVPVSRTADLDSRPPQTLDSRANRSIDAPARPLSPAQPSRFRSGSEAEALGEGETIRLLEERLLVEQRRRKVGEIVVHKVVDTQMIQVPVRRERLVVEQVSPERKQLATIELGQTLEAVQALEPGVRHQANGLQNGNRQAAPLAQSVTQSATLDSTQQFLAKLAQRHQLAQAKLRLVFDDPELQSYYQRWLDKG